MRHWCAHSHLCVGVALRRQGEPAGQVRERTRSREGSCTTGAVDGRAGGDGVNCGGCWRAAASSDGASGSALRGGQVGRVGAATGEERLEVQGVPTGTFVGSFGG